MISNKIIVALLYGGRSVEHGVSINSARNVSEHIDKESFEVIHIGISQNGAWYLTDHVVRDIHSGKPLHLNLDPGKPSLLDSEGNQYSIDVAFPILHGTDGEDGSIQGLLKAMDIPMIGTGVLGSALSMNKLITKKILQLSGIPVSKFLYTQLPNRNQYTFEQLKKEIGLPFMVKAANLGSSVGISKVVDEQSFAKAMDDAFAYDQTVLFEEYIEGRELECAVMGNHLPKASIPGEIIISSNYDFYSFDAKYVDDKAVTIEVPAHLDEHTIAKIQQLAVRAYQALHCEDFARVDLFLRNDGQIFINEINTIPGFTNSSMFPVMWQHGGLSFSKLISELIQLGTQRVADKKDIQRNFNSALKY